MFPAVVPDHPDVGRTDGMSDEKIWLAKTLGLASNDGSEKKAMDVSVDGLPRFFLSSSDTLFLGRKLVRHFKDLLQLPPPSSTTAPLPPKSILFFK